MKILHITDSHGTVKGPESRKDIYYLSFLKKLYELQYVIKKEKIDVVIHTGDLFHTARVSDKFTGQTAELIKAMKVPFYVVPGNHDIEGYTIDTIDQTKLGLLTKTGVIKILDRENPIVLTGNCNGEIYTVAISGQEYYAHIDEGNAKDFEMQQDEADLNILAIHGYLTDIPQHPDIKCTMCKDVISDANIILTGHYHRQFEWSDNQNLSIFNPGSMMRVEQTEYNKTHIPQYGILDIGLDDQGYIEWDYKFHTFKIASPSTEIFDYTSKYQAKHTSITLDNFKNSLANSMSHVNASTNNIQTIIHDICNKASINANIEAKAINVYNSTLQSIPDEFEAPSGFIEGVNTKKISKVFIKNFQSHKDTVLELNPGLNIIVGESNNGKTAIFRAIMWAIDNQPLGNDFIMAGQDDCSVRIEYDDGTWIERGRTVKDTGYYKIGYFDDNGVLQTAEYRGFTNAVPVEIANVHQMPKVNITKDIETHLNVLSQLDGPFLLTESPMVKASAIGRITGTHILDTGIKETNKTIQSNKKTVKVYNESLAEKELELKQLPNIQLMEQFYNKYEMIYNYTSTLLLRIKQINKLLTDFEKIEDMAKIEYENIINNKNIAKLLPVIDKAKDDLNKCLYLQSKINSYQNLVAEIKRNDCIIQSSKVFVSMAPIIRTSLDKISIINTLSNGITNVNKCVDDINICNEQIKYNKTFISSINSITVYCNTIMNIINNIYPKMDLVHDIELKEETAKNECTGYKKFMKAVKTTITKTNKERTQFILNKGYCPCCGQSVCETTNINSIIDFFKEDK